MNLIASYIHKRVKVSNHGEKAITITQKTINKNETKIVNFSDLTYLCSMIPDLNISYEMCK